MVRCRQASSRGSSAPSKPRKRRLMYHNRNRIKCLCLLETSLQILSHNRPQSIRIHKERQLKLGPNWRLESAEVKLNLGIQLQHRILLLIMVLLTKAMAKILSVSSLMARVELPYQNKVTSLIHRQELEANLCLSGNDNNRKYRWIR